jgi:glycosyltransferase
VAQGFHSKEHIIVDGCSSDGSLEIISKYRHQISRLISEPDKGIYDAMNKGIAQAKGDVIGILNADDLYANNQVLAIVSEIFSNEYIDSCYGDLLYVDASDTGLITRYWQAGDYHVRKFYWGWMPPHPTFFVRRKIYKKYGGFNLELGTAADYELMLRFLVRYKIRTHYIPEILVKMRSGGVSNRSFKDRLSANYHDRLAWKVNGLQPYPWTLLFKPLSKVNQWNRRILIKSILSKWEDGSSQH